MSFLTATGSCTGFRAVGAGVGGVDYIGDRGPERGKVLMGAEKCDA